MTAASGPLISSLRLGVTPGARGEEDHPLVMALWTTDELADIERAEEIRIAPIQADGTAHSPVVVWAVRAGDDLYVRSAVKGADAAWYRRALETHQGRLSAGRLEDNDSVDAAYRKKYRRYAGRILNSCLTPEAQSTTLRLVPRSNASKR
jgi:hypothetical protein